MADAAEAFSQFADFMPESLLLVSSSGTLRAANRRAREDLFRGAGEIIEKPMTALFEDPAKKITGYLKMCSRSSRPLPGTLTLPPRVAAFPGRVLRTDGWAVKAPGSDAPAVVVLRLAPKEPAVNQFLTLNRRIDQLMKEVSLRLRAEHSAHEQREMLRVTLSSIGDGVVTTDTAARITFMNPVAEAHTGWKLQEALGRPLDEVFVIRNEESGSSVENPVARVLREGYIVGLANHTVLVRRDDTRIPIDDSGAPILDTDGNLLGVVLVFHEISERRKLERELRRQASALRQADKRKDQFLAMLAHELRNPLAPLHTCVQILRGRDAPPDNFRQLVDMMARQTRQLARLVDDLLDISRITRGTIRLERKPTLLTDIIRHAVETVRPAIEERAHKLDVKLPRASLAVDGDLTRLSQVFCNLLTNSSKFMEPGGRITIEATAEGGSAVVKVCDLGMGLSEELLPNVFDLFEQGSRGLDREYGGLGIGLTLVKSLVTMHDGEVSAFSEGPGKGAEFTVRLPIVASQTEPAEEKSAAPRPLRKRVLIIDDNIDAAESLAMLLSANGCDASTVHEGRAAVQRVAYDRPDAVLLDIGLPGLDGYEVARRLRRLPIPAPLIVGVSGYGSELDRTRAKEAGFDHHLVKPVELQDLIDLLQ